jgi:hypothetical protein
VAAAGGILHVEQLVAQGLIGFASGGQRGKTVLDGVALGDDRLEVRDACLLTLGIGSASAMSRVCSFNRRVRSASRSAAARRWDGASWIAS